MPQTLKTPSRALMRTTFITQLAFLMTADLLAQKISQIAVRQEGSNVVVSYKLDGETGKAYHVSLYSSHNNFASPLRLVEGEVGDKRVLPGADKSIRWRAQEELTRFDGDISFELRAAKAPPLFTSITASSSKVKRGGEVTITWAGGIQDNLAVELVKGSSVVQAGSKANTGKLVYAVAEKMKTGPYTVVLKQAGETTAGANIAVKAKYPLWLKLTPLLVGVAVWQLLPDSSDDDFPEPPDLTGN